MICSVVGTGPSYTGEPVEGFVICVADAADFIPHQIAVYCDQEAYDRKRGRFHGAIVVGPDVSAPGAIQIPYSQLVTEAVADGLYRGSSTGAFALNLAVVMKFERILLYGFDCGFVAGKSNFFDAVEVKGREYPESGYKAMLADFERFRPYADRVVNMSEHSAISVFPKLQNKK